MASNNPQYHYLYGSVDDRRRGGDDDDGDDDGHHHQDDESLEGEGLIPTDNETDGENHPLLVPPDRRDLQQLMLIGNGSNGNGRGGGGGGAATLLPNHFPGTGRRKPPSHSSGGFMCCFRRRKVRDEYGQQAAGEYGYGYRVHSSSSQQQQQHSSSPFREKHPALYTVAWAGAIAIFGCCVAAAIFPNSRIGSLAKTASSQSSASIEKNFVVPFPSVDRDEYGNDPVSDLIDVDLFDPALVSGGGNGKGKGSGGRKRPRRGASPADASGGGGGDGTFVFPFPTGAFWTNLVLPPTADRNLSFPVAVYPYAYSWSDEALQVSYPASHRKQEPKAVHDYFFPDLTFGVAEEISKRYVTAFDALSVTLRYTTATAGSLETYLVQGSPYVTLKYDFASPTIRAFSLFDSVFCPRDDVEYSQLIDDTSNTGNNVNSNSNNNNQGGSSRRRLDRRLVFGICQSEQSGKEMYLRGVQFIIKTQEGMNWMVFSSEPLELIYDISKRTTILSPNKFNGVLRLALLPKVLDSSTYNAATFGSGGSTVRQGSNNDNTTRVIEGSSGLQRLIYHAGVYPTSGSVSWTFKSAESGASNLGQVAAKAITGAIGLASGTTTPAPSSAKSSSKTSGSDSSSTTVGTTSGPSSRVASLSFQFTTKTFSPPSSTSSPVGLLMLALPHHAQSLPSSWQLGKDQFDLVYRCIKGPMRPVLGSAWTYDEPLPMIGFDKYYSVNRQASSSSSSAASTPVSGGRIKEYMHPLVRAEILKSLNEDIKLALPTMDENIYGFGKQTARLAQLAHIAHQLQSGRNATGLLKKSNSTDSRDSRRQESTASPDDEDKELMQVHDRAVELLAYTLEHFLSNNVSDNLVYDRNFGGLVTTDGLHNKEADFGNGRYNDHHFHYGYILYACAILGKIDSTFIDRYGSRVDAIYYDVAHDSNFASPKARHPGETAFFPGSRHKAWFDGHSFSSGLFPFSNGKSQESSSEAVNCYFGAYLWSLVRHGAANNPEADISPQTDFARLLLATEIRGAQMYWHMTPPEPVSSQNKSVAVPSATATTVYNAEFSQNFMVGNLGMLDVVSSTWFGTEPLYVHLINEIPITAVTEDLFNKAYVSKEYSHILKPLGEVEMAWQGYLVCNHAIVDPQAAWKQALELFSPQLDSALSKSEVLYWVSTRPGFNATLAASGRMPPSPSIASLEPRLSQSGNSSGSHDGSSCALYTACTQLGLTGECCPTPDNTKLECCNL